MRLVSAYYEEFFPFQHMEGMATGISTYEPGDLKEGDVLVVWGGSDISPTLYDRPVSTHCHATAKLSKRDLVEWELMKRAKELGLPIIGVCRGAQMLCALAGGFLLQDVNKHGGTHTVATPDGYEFTTNSIHHQMMYPFDVKHEMLASIKPPLATRHYDVEDVITIEEEPEYVYFPEVKGHAVQWHPEAMSLESKATQYIFKMFKEKHGNASQV